MSSTAFASEDFFLCIVREKPSRSKALANDEVRSHSRENLQTLGDCHPRETSTISIRDQNGKRRSAITRVLLLRTRTLLRVKVWIRKSGLQHGYQSPKFVGSRGIVNPPEPATPEQGSLNCQGAGRDAQEGRG
jgi:hypothetical protein